MRVTEAIPIPAIGNRGIFPLLKKYGLELSIVLLKGYPKYLALSREEDRVVGSLWRTNLHGKSIRKVKKELKKFLRQYGK